MPPKIHGHRGARGRCPENTLSAIHHALTHGADGVEVDICVTADDEIVAHHDLRLNPDVTRDEHGEWIAHRLPIRDLPLRELRRYDVGRLRPGSDYAAQFPEQTPVDGTRIPTLEECIELLRAHDNDIVLNLEMKNAADTPALTPAPEDYLRLLREKLDRSTFPQPQLFLQSFDWDLMASAKKHCPNLKIGFTQKHPCTSADLATIKSSGGDVLSCHHRALTAPLIQKARNLGLEVYAWTVNDRHDMEKMAKLGVDVVITDYPDRYCVVSQSL